MVAASTRNDAKALTAGSPFRFDGVAGWVFDFLASLKLAVILLLVFGFVCVAGTLYESSYTARLARRLIYESKWFDFLLVAIFINVLFSTLSRYPWRISQIGWLVTHLGVLVILAGSWVSHKFGVEGNLTLEEGQSGDRISQSDFRIFFQEVGKDDIYRFNSSEVEWGHPERSPQEYPFDELDLTVTVDNFFPHSGWVEDWGDDNPSENPAVHVTIENDLSETMVEGWLVPAVVGRQHLDLQAARVAVRVIADEAGMKAELAPSVTEQDPGKGWLEVRIKETGETRKVDVAEAMERKVPVEGTDYLIFVTSQYDYAYVDQNNELAENPARKPNPAVLYEIHRGDTKVADRLFEFALMPEFGSMHGIREEVPFEVTYQRQIEGQADRGAEIAILIGPGEGLSWKVTSSDGSVSGGPLEVDDRIPLESMQNMSLVVDRYLRNAQRHEKIVAMPIERGDFRNKAAHLRVSDSSGNETEFWQEAYDRQEIELGDRRFLVGYEPKEVPLGFSIQLKDFRLITYPGSAGRPMSYESDVRVVDRSGNETTTRDVTIAMNQPMDHGGYRVFQSSYHDFPKGDPRISVFSIARDPGISVLYFGSIVMCVGIAIMFWGKQFLSDLELKSALKKVPQSISSVK